MSRDLLDLVRELNTLNDDNLADRVIANSDVQWCLSELQDILEEMPTLIPPNEPLTLEHLREMDGEPVWVERENAWGIVEIQEGKPFIFGTNFECGYSPHWNIYRRPPEGEEDT